MAEMRLQLQPADLGEIELRVRTMEGVVRGHLMVHQPEVKQLLEAQINRLREALEEQGLRLAGIDVDLARDQSFGQSRDPQDSQPDRAVRQARASGQVESEPNEPATWRPGGDGEVDYVV